MEHRVRRLKDHYIVCGCGRVGMPVVQELSRNGVAAVLIDRSPTLLESLDAPAS